MRWALRLVVGLVTLVAPGICQAGAISVQAGSEQQVLVLLNQIRQQHHLTGLTLSAPLRTAARAHSLDMLRNAYFDHDSPGETSDDRIGRYLRSTLTGEDIAFGVVAAVCDEPTKTMPRIRRTALSLRSGCDRPSTGP